MAKPKFLKFARASGGVVLLQPIVVSMIARYTNPAIENSEAGGVLLGRSILESSDIVVDMVTVPTSKDTRSRYSFLRARSPHQKLINQAWKGSEGTCVYLGEWHCHPEDDPTPSGQDINNWGRIVSTARYEQSSLLFLIAGYQRVRIWEYSKIAANLVQLAPLRE